MSANTEVFHGSGWIAQTRERVWPQTDASRETEGWNREGFAREQIRSLVQRVFLANGGRAVKQVVFSATEARTDVATICQQVGQALALETLSDIAIVDRPHPAPAQTMGQVRYAGRAPIKSWSTPIAANLWRVPGSSLRDRVGESATGLCWLSGLADLRNEFQYAIIQGPAAGVSSEAALLGHLADGMILVLGDNTRKATACKIKEMLEGAQTRILGTVLSERRFPVPERIYRRL